MLNVIEHIKEFVRKIRIWSSSNETFCIYVQGSTFVSIIKIVPFLDYDCSVLGLKRGIKTIAVLEYILFEWNLLNLECLK